MEVEKEKEKEEAATATTGESGQVISSKVLREAVANVKDGLHLLEENDPNVDRSSTVSRNVLDNLLGYTEMGTFRLVPPPSTFSNLSKIR